MINRIVNQAVQKHIIETLANNPYFQRFAASTHDKVSELAKKRLELTDHITEKSVDQLGKHGHRAEMFLRAYADELRQAFNKLKK
ncbi:hypothetical protein SmJEL517_g05986 [Synchytrium microbalum]|uniref:Uncharacterized protein n=1 Tax=Synchytrium microbalum TaxID=1806994 RepID=A0A507BHZ3_9FUNG|nr:uncharacterized protein SmJEL517_g05986 [Synchytrium microbalum]TPX30430.1 hypothetical protein SmJEL517_g05986 [Synchytrium microbalum]